jgi:cyclic pyranopterin phosphate synthase
MSPTLDLHRRPLRNLRLSVTDRCNLRCGYCMPEERYTWLEKAKLLTFEESTALVAELVPHGVEKVRLTGGEPLLRRDIDQLVRSLRSLAGLKDLALTTNGLRLPDLAPALRDAGLDRLTVSLDTLRADRFLELTRRDELERALRGLDAAAAAGFRETKLNVVVMRGTNDDELVDMLDFARERELEVRFIEYMDVGGATRWDMSRVVPATEIIERIGAARGGVTPEDLKRTAAPADRYRTADGQRFGVIASTTRPFCGSCDRGRLTADGQFITCLYARSGTALAPLLRSNGAAAAAERIVQLWTGRTDRGAEERASLDSRGALAGPSELQQEPHLEMHTRGG